jgi:hypothetical protein
LEHYSNHLIYPQVIPVKVETKDERELRLLRELQAAVTRYVTPFNQGRPCISIDTLRQTVTRIRREIGNG